MKNYLLILVLLLSFNFSNAQLYTQNQPIDSILYYGSYFPNGCIGPIEIDIQLDTSLYHYVEGLSFMIIIDSVYFAGPPGTAPVQTGDTIVLDSINPRYALISISGLEFWFSIHISGIPLIAYQNYPCNIEFLQCTCFCTNINIQPSQSYTSMCNVELSNFIQKNEDQNTTTIYPNPSNGKFFIANGNNVNSIEVYNIIGNKILTINNLSSNEINLSNTARGIYFVKMFSGEKTYTNKIIIE